MNQPKYWALEAITLVLKALYDISEHICSATYDARRAIERKQNAL